MMRRMAVVVAAIVCGCCVFAKDPAPLPTADEFHACVLAIVKGYPTDGTNGYYWPKGSDWAGTTRDLMYEGRKVADGDPQGRCYCCGLTFEVLFRAWEKWCADHKAPFRIGDLSADDLLKFRGLWFGNDGNRKMIPHALEEFKIGHAVERLEDALPGDFVQLWRKSGSGHSVVFLGWTKDPAGKISGIRYWSSQKATNGIGEREEAFGGEAGVDPEQVYVARVGGTKAGVRK